MSPVGTGGGPVNIRLSGLVLSRTSVTLTVVCPVVLSAIESGVSRCLIIMHRIIINRPISPFNSASSCFRCYGALPLRCAHLGLLSS